MGDRRRPGFPDWGHAGHPHGHDGYPFLHLLLLLLFLALLAVLAVAVWRRLASRSQGVPVLGSVEAGGVSTDALGIVRLRYARGEIDRDEYLQVTEDLGGTPPPPAPAVDAPSTG